MKVTCVFVAALATASAFAPSVSNGRVATELMAAKKDAPKKETLFSTIFNMDLFAPNKDVNDYGARNKKPVKLAKIGSNSYVPAGLTAAQYQKIRDEEVAKKDSIYKKNVAKAGKFKDYTEFYLKRGTDSNDAWKKSVTLGHDMAKTKYDFSGKADVQKSYDGKI